jgi:hypothetical protein
MRQVREAALLQTPTRAREHALEYQSIDARHALLSLHLARRKFVSDEHHSRAANELRRTGCGETERLG